MQRSTASLGLALLLVAAATGLSSQRATSTDVPTADRQPSPSVATADRDNEGEDDGDDDAKPFTYAVIGDFPYGATKRAEMPALVDQINADPAVERVLHMGDIRSGSNGDCSDAYFADIKSQFDRFEDPLVYTPGDNEWTDCHTAIKNNGLYKPTERLAKVREVFFPTVGRTMGVKAAQVTSQARVDRANGAFVENVIWNRKGVVFASINVTGSNDDTAPWTSTPAKDGELPGLFSTYAAQLAEQPAEIAARAKANTAWLERAFLRARDDDTKAVVIMFQADLWDGTMADRTTTISAYDALVVKLGTLAAKLGKPVLLLMGDSHVFNLTNPFTPSSPLFALHPNTPVATNVTRLVVNGCASRTEYVRLTIDPQAKGVNPFSIEEVPLK
jgi:hypothetical protein